LPRPQVCVCGHILRECLPETNPDICGGLHRQVRGSTK
jgi:hypothetical protein